MVNKLRGIFSTLAVKAPGFGDRRKEILEDIAVVTGGQVISEEKGMKLETMNIDMLGIARKIVASKENTTIVEGKGEQKKIDERIIQIKNEIKISTSDFDKEKLQERLAKLSGGVAVIKVGAATEVEQKAKQHKIEDAVNATKAAIEEGVIPGGGVALAVASAMTSVTDGGGRNVSDLEKRGYIAGIEIVKKASQVPMKQIVKNAGAEEIALHDILKKINETKKGTQIKDLSQGYDTLTGKIVDMFEAGIVDPTKVVRSALENAASAAAMFLTTEVVVAEKLDDKGGSSMPSGMGGMGGMPGMGM